MVFAKPPPIKENSDTITSSKKNVKSFVGDKPPIVFPDTKTCCPFSYLTPGFKILILLTTPLLTSKLICKSEPYPPKLVGLTVYVLSGIADASPDWKVSKLTKPP